jgi:hypothetical protein
VGATGARAAGAEAGGRGVGGRGWGGTGRGGRGGSSTGGGGRGARVRTDLGPHQLVRVIAPARNVTFGFNRLLQNEKRPGSLQDLLAHHTTFDNNPD